MDAHRCAVVLVIGASFGGVLAGCSDDSDDASPPTVETVLDLQGTWSDEDTWSDDRSLWPTPPRWGPTTLILTDCAVGEQCGHLERIDDHRELCVYELVYRSADANGFNFETSGGGGGFSCGYSPWSFGVLHVTPGADGTIEVVASAVEGTATTLRRAED